MDSSIGLRVLLEMLDPLTRDALRRVLIRDHGDDWADIIDMLTMYSEARCAVVRSVDSRRSR